MSGNLLNTQRIKDFMIRLDYFRYNCLQTYLRKDFLELSDKLINKIWSVDRYFIDRVYVLWKVSFFLI